MTTPRRPSPKTGRDEMVPEDPGQCSQCVVELNEKERANPIASTTSTRRHLSVRASRHAAAGDRRDTHECGTAVGTCASEACPSRVVCAWPAPPGRFGVVAVTAPVGFTYLSPIDSPAVDLIQNSGVLVDIGRPLVHSHPSHPGKNTHTLISAIPTRRKRRLLIILHTYLSGG